MNMNKWKSKIDVTCLDCNEVYHMRYDGYHSKPSDYHWRCKKCRDIENGKFHKNRISALSEEEKLKRNSLLRDSSQSFWKSISKEDRYLISHKISNSLIDYQKNLTTDGKNKISKTLKSVWKSRTSEDKSRILRLLEDGRGHYHTLSDDKKLEWSQRSRENSLNYWNNLSDDDYDNIRRLMSMGWSGMSDDRRSQMSDRLKNAWKNKSADELIEHAEKSRRWWASLTSEHKSEIIDRQKKWWNSLSEEHRKAISDNHKDAWKNMPRSRYEEIIFKIKKGLEKHYNALNDGSYETNSSIEFRNAINIINSKGGKINYMRESPNEKVHHDFYSIYTHHPFFKNRSVSPFKNWDYRLIVNEKHILVDIDGSSHIIPEGQVIYNRGMDNELDRGAYTKWLDQKRKYCTDNLDAYVIMCYDDKLTDDTMVMKLNSNSKPFPFRLFKSIISTAL